LATLADSAQGEMVLFSSAMVAKASAVLVVTNKKFAKVHEPLKPPYMPAESSHISILAGNQL
jgi:hypothetical protein